MAPTAPRWLPGLNQLGASDPGTAIAVAVVEHEPSVLCTHDCRITDHLAVPTRGRTGYADLFVTASPDETVGRGRIAESVTGAFADGIPHPICSQIVEHERATEADLAVFRHWRQTFDAFFVPVEAVRRFGMPEAVDRLNLAADIDPCAAADVPHTPSFAFVEHEWSGPDKGLFVSPVENRC